MDKDKKVIEEGQLPVKVAKDVVSSLSIGLYRNFARAVKELISNSYDAGATEVKIKLDLDSTPSKIIIRDNGRGMNKEDIKGKFLFLGFPTPLSEEKDNLGRKRIGTFGIGCISIFPYCKTVRVISKKIKEDKIIEVTINAEQFFKGDTFDIKKVKVPYQTYKSDLPCEQGETIIILEGLKPHIVEELKHEDFSGKSSIEKYGGFQKFKWSLSQYIPVDFSSSREDLKEFFKVPGKVPIRVWLNGEELFRNVPEDAKILEKGEETFDVIKLKYAIMSPLEPVKPGEAKGFQIRLRDVAVGLPTDFNIISLTGKVPGKLNWICGEIHILRGLGSSLMIDRDSFSFTKEVSDVHDFFRKKLSFWNDELEDWASEDKKIYESVRDMKESEKVIKDLKKVGILRIPRERLRIKKDPIVKRVKKEVLPHTEELKKTLSNRGYKIISKRGEIKKETPPVEVITKEKSILIHEDHPDLKETLKIGSNLYPVEYDSWNLGKTPFDICKLLDDRKTVVFNKLHPLFKSKLDDEIIKKLSLGILLITKGRKDQGDLVEKINKLLTEVF